MEQLPRELEEKLDKMEEYLSRFGRAIKCVRDGEPFDEAFDEVFLEDAADEKKVVGKISRAMSHLLKLGYCNSDVAFRNNKRAWIQDFHYPRNEVLELLVLKKQRKNLTKYANKNIHRMYKGAISFYDLAAKEYDDLKEGRKWIPEQCPWTFNELISQGPKDLVFMLPNHLRKDSDFK